MPFFGGGGASVGIGGSTGATDNAILRADGTGAATLQNSDLLVSDYSSSTQGGIAMLASVAGFSCTASASTDIVTATGHNFVASQCVAFTSLSGGGGLATTRAYFVRDISGNTFKLSNEIGAGAIDITSDLTAGTIVPCVAIILNPQSFGSFILGPQPDGTATGGNQRGFRSVDLQFSRSASTQIAGPREYAAVLGGQSNTASGLESGVFCGNGNTASADRSVVIGGSSSTVSGVRSGAFAGTSHSITGSECACVGGFLNSASGTHAVALGRNANADRRNLIAQGNIRWSTNGDAQRISSVLSCKTTTNSAVEMFIDDSIRLTVASGKVMSMLINITGVRSDGSAVAHYVRQYSIKNVAGTTSEVYAPVTIGTDNAAGTSITVDANDTNDALRIQCTGVASQTWRWVASVDAVEVAYGT